MFRKVYDSLLTLVYPQVVKFAKAALKFFGTGTVCRGLLEKDALFYGLTKLSARNAALF